MIEVNIGSCNTMKYKANLLRAILINNYLFFNHAALRRSIIHVHFPRPPRFVSSKLGPWAQLFNDGHVCGEVGSHVLAREHMPKKKIGCLSKEALGPRGCILIVFI